MPHIKIHYAPHSTRRRELAFAKTVLRMYPRAEHVKKTYPIDRQLAGRALDRDAIADALKRDQLIRGARRSTLLDSLSELPRFIHATGRRKDSCDLTIESDRDVFFFEFHEEQHRDLSDNRMRALYSDEGTKFWVCRYVQRFLRDAWRMVYLPNITVIWFDWFDQNARAFEPALRSGAHECAVDNRLSFKDLLGHLRAP